LDMRDTDADYHDTPYGKYAHSSVIRRGVELGFQSVHAGIRAYSREEYEFARRHERKIFEWGIGEDPSVEEVVGAISTKRVYLTVDVDGIDPAHMGATGTPVQGGLSWKYVLLLFRELFSKKEVIGADIVEVAPNPNENLTEFGAAQLAYHIIGLRFEPVLPKYGR